MKINLTYVWILIMKVLRTGFYPQTLVPHLGLGQVAGRGIDNNQSITSHGDKNTLPGLKGNLALILL